MALLLNGKRFPPMLPRELRVSRCKAPHKTARAAEKKTAEKVAALKANGRDRKGSHKYVPKLTAEQQTMAGRAGKLLGHSAAAKARVSSSKPGASARKPGSRRDRQGEDRPAGKKEEAPPGIKTPEAFIFEGRRASSKDGLPKDLKMKVKGKKKFGGGGHKLKKPAKK